MLYTTVPLQAAACCSGTANCTNKIKYVKTSESIVTRVDLVTTNKSQTVKPIRAERIPGKSVW